MRFWSMGVVQKSAIHKIVKVGFNNHSGRRPSVMEKAKGQTGIRDGGHGRTHRLCGLVGHGDEGLQTGRTPQECRSCTMAMHATVAWQAARSAAAAVQPRAGPALGSSPRTSTLPDASRTDGAAPLKHYLVHSAAGIGGPSAPTVRPHCTARPGRAAGEQGAAASGLAVGLAGIALPHSMNAPDVTPSPVLVAMDEKMPRAAPQKCRSSQGRRIESLGACYGAGGRRSSSGAQARRHGGPPAQAALRQAACPTATRRNLPEGGAEPLCAQAIGLRRSYPRTRGKAFKAPHASFKRREDRG